MLQLRPNCECCTDTRLQGHCPNCGGELVRRPVRPADKLVNKPASTERVFKPQGCAPASLAAQMKP